MSDIIPFTGKAATAARVYGQVSDDSRRAMLNLHINRTIERCLEALRNPWRFAGRQEALEIITAAAPAYTRLGGASQYWPSTPVEDDTMALAELLGVTRPKNWDVVELVSVPVCTGLSNCPVCKAWQEVRSDD